MFWLVNVVEMVMINNNVELISNLVKSKSMNFLKARKFKNI